MEKILRIEGRICVSVVGEFFGLILSESHYSIYSIHPGVSKIYDDLR